MRKHALEATNGRTYAEMGRFVDKSGKETNNEKLAAKDPKTGQPVENQARNIWVTETALSTALNVAYFAERVSVFSIVMGFALLLTGVGFLVLTLSLLRPVVARHGAPALSSRQRRPPARRRGSVDDEHAQRPRRRPRKFVGRRRRRGRARGPSVAGAPPWKSLRSLEHEGEPTA